MAAISMNTAYEPQVDKVVALTRKYLKRDPRVLVEIGARDCKETVAFSKLFPNTTIHAFECDPITLPQCRERVRGNDHIVLHETAVSDVVGTIDFYVMPEDPGSSSIYVHKEMEQRKETLPSTTLAHEFSVAPDIIWLDTQGAELKILKGAGDLLAGVSLIHSEIYFRAAYDGQPLYKDIKRYLNAHGFELLAFTSLGRNFADAVFINRNVYKRLTPQWTTEFPHWLTERVTGHSRGLLLRTAAFVKRIQAKQ